MSLQTLQTNLLGLIKSRNLPNTSHDAYLRLVANSPNLALAKKIIHWWRQRQVEDGCPLTANILRAYGLLEDETERFTNGSFSVFHEEVGVEFINRILEARESLPEVVALVATLELRLIKINEDNQNEDEIDWPYEPFGIIQAILDNTFTEALLIPGNFRVVFRKDNPSLFEVYEIAL